MCARCGFRGQHFISSVRNDGVADARGRFQTARCVAEFLGLAASFVAFLSHNGTGELANLVEFFACVFALLSRAGSFGEFAAGLRATFLALLLALALFLVPLLATIPLAQLYLAAAFVFCLHALFRELALVLPALHGVVEVLA